MVLGFSFRALGVCVSSLLAREGCRKSKHIVVQLGPPSLVRVFAFMLQAKAQHPPPPFMSSFLLYAYRAHVDPRLCT